MHKLANKRQLELLHQEEERLKASRAPDNSNLLNQGVLDGIREGVDGMGINWKKRAENAERERDHLLSELERQELRMLRQFFAILNRMGVL